MVCNLARFKLLLSSYVYLITSFTSCKRYFIHNTYIICMSIVVYMYTYTHTYKHIYSRTQKKSTPPGALSLALSLFNASRVVRALSICLHSFYFIV